MGLSKSESHIGKITSGITSTLSDKTIEFVNSMLPEWRDHPDRIEEESEKKLNMQLSTYLDVYARTIFPMVRFNHEECQTGRRSVDFSAKPVEKIIIDAKQHTIFEPFLVFECKRLPAPEKGRKMEYVTGGKKETSGGIQRFKIGAHGAEQNQAVMIGYIQKHSPKTLLDNINKWITELAKGTIEDVCSWDTGETLNLISKDNSKGLTNYRSHHSRTDSKSSNNIKLDHLWVVMHK